MLERGANHPAAYKSMAVGLQHVYETRGLKGLWAGFIPSSLGVLHGAVQFSIYENMKKRRGTQVGGQEKLSNWEYVYMSGGSKLLAGAITYPYQPIRARMQQYNAAQQYNGLLDVLRKTYQNEGFLAFYKGSVMHKTAHPWQRRNTNVRVVLFPTQFGSSQQQSSRLWFMRTRNYTYRRLSKTMKIRHMKRIDATFSMSSYTINMSAIDPGLCTFHYEVLRAFSWRLECLDEHIEELSYYNETSTIASFERGEHKSRETT